MLQFTDINLAELENKNVKPDDNSNKTILIWINCFLKLGPHGTDSFFSEWGYGCVKTQSVCIFYILVRSCNSDSKCSVASPTINEKESGY